MNASEAEYVDKFRRLAASQFVIVRAVRDLKAVCQSLDNWRATASDLNQGGMQSAEAWSVDRLRGLAKLRDLLGEYDAARQDLQAAWNGLNPETERPGLSEPSSLDK